LNYKPRPATDKEVAELQDFYKENYGVELDYEDWNRWVGVFDHYITDCPAYSGKFMFVVWGGSPALYEAFIWIDGEMKKAEQAEEMRDRK